MKGDSSDKTTVVKKKKKKMKGDSGDKTTVVEVDTQKEVEEERIPKKSEEESKMESPVKDIFYYFKEYVHKDESESEEEVLGDSDRVENDWGYEFDVDKSWNIVTNPRVPLKTYFRSKGVKRKGKKRDRGSIPSVLRDPDLPVAALSKLALKTYNQIQKTKYEYVGLVKAYEQAVNGFRFWTRFKACLRGQDAIDFQAITFLGRPDPKSDVVPVRFEFIYPLRPS